MKKIFLMGVLFFLALSQGALAQTTDTTTTTTDTATGDQAVTTRTEETPSRISPGGFYMEPMLLVTRADSSINTSQLPMISDDTTGTEQGYGLGLRLGGHVSEILLLGVDARYAKTQMQDSSYGSADAQSYNVAPVIGLQTPLFGIRLLAGYVAAGENNPEAGSRGLDLKFKDANGWRVGAGLHVAALSVNLEYQDLKYNTTDVESFGSLNVNSTSDIDVTNRGYALTIGFPIEL